MNQTPPELTIRARRQANAGMAFTLDFPPTDDLLATAVKASDELATFFPHLDEPSRVLICDYMANVTAGFAKEYIREGGSIEAITALTALSDAFTYMTSIVGASLTEPVIMFVETYDAYVPPVRAETDEREPVIDGYGDELAERYGNVA